MEKCNNCLKMFGNGVVIGSVLCSGTMLLLTLLMSSCSTLPKEEIECADETKEIEELYTELEKCGEVEKCEVDIDKGDTGEQIDTVIDDTGKDSETSICDTVVCEPPIKDYNKCITPELIGFYNVSTKGKCIEIHSGPGFICVPVPEFISECKCIEENETTTAHCAGDF